ncbi:MAG: hypothetical protein GY835_24045 [bacterium]|nr:hypothetical protein [bacterium]
MSIRNLTGPTPTRLNSGAKRWLIRWLDDETKRSKSFKSRGEAQKFRNQLKARVEVSALQLPEVAEFDGSAASFKLAIAEGVRLLQQALAAGNREAMGLIRTYVAGLKDLAAAVVPHAGYIELEREHAELVQYTEDLLAQRAGVDDATKPTALRIPGSTLKESARSKPAPN